MYIGIGYQRFAFSVVVCEGGSIIVPSVMEQYFTTDGEIVIGCTND
jgi:hypothetical protein